MSYLMAAQTRTGRCTAEPGEQFSGPCEQAARSSALTSLSSSLISDSLVTASPNFSVPPPSPHLRLPAAKCWNHPETSPKGGSGPAPVSRCPRSSLQPQHLQHFAAAQTRTGREPRALRREDTDFLEPRGRGANLFQRLDLPDMSSAKFSSSSFLLVSCCWLSRFPTSRRGPSSISAR